MLVFEVATHFRSPKWADWIGILGLGVAFVVTIMQKVHGFSGQWKFAGLATGFFCLCLACFAADGYLAKIFRWTPLRWLGNISYSYYLIHGLVVNIFFTLLPKLFPPTGADVVVFWLAFGLAFPATVLVSTLLFLWVERPFSLGPSKTRTKQA
jgi:peptidoglycan/LPS O-acetylase OafA/YrhL